MSEPTGHTVDGTPWEEARGPHLPDRLTRIPVLVWPFVVLALFQVAATWQQWGDQIDRDLGVLPQVAVSVAIEISPILLGAALFLRHPDAVRALPLLVVGATLLALEQLAGLLRQPLIESIWAPQPDVFESLPLAMLPSTVYGFFAIAIGTVGMGFLALGLQRARRRSTEVSRVLVAALAVVAVLMTGYRVGYSLPGIEETLGPIGPFVAAADTVLSLVSGLVLAYFFVVAFAGWRAGERPLVGWAFAALAGGLAIVVPAGFAVLSMIPIGDWSGLPFSVSLALIAAAPLALLAAFVVGIPATDEPAETAPEPTPDPPGATTPGSAGS